MAEENKEELELVEVTEEATNTEETQGESAENQNQEETTSEDEEEFVKNKKSSLIKKILIGVISLLGLVLLSGIVLYFTGFFDEPEPKVENKVTTEKISQTQNDTLQNNEPREYKFDISDINSKKLNKQLALLTNEHLKKDKKNEELEKLENEKKILEEEKRKHQEALAAEEEKLIQEKELLEAKKNELEMQKNELELLKQEALMLKEQLEKDKEVLESIALEKQNMQEEYKKEEVLLIKTQNQENEDVKTEEDKTTQKSEYENPFLLLINVATIKGELYKEYLDKVTTVNPNISLCRDDKNRIEIYYGPFNSNEERKILFEKLKENDFKESFEVELTKEEFNKRCKY